MLKILHLLVTVVMAQLEERFAVHRLHLLLEELDLILAKQLGLPHSADQL
jgi:hypothetical protein